MKLLRIYLQNNQLLVKEMVCVYRVFCLTKETFNSTGVLLQVGRRDSRRNRGIE